VPSGCPAGAYVAAARAAGVCAAGCSRSRRLRGRSATPRPGARPSATRRPLPQRAITTRRVPNRAARQILQPWSGISPRLTFHFGHISLPRPARDLGSRPQHRRLRHEQERLLAAGPDRADSVPPLQVRRGGWGSASSAQPAGRSPHPRPRHPASPTGAAILAISRSAAQNPHRLSQNPSGYIDAPGPRSSRPDDPIAPRDTAILLNWKKNSALRRYFRLPWRHEQRGPGPATP
jgi:hypothetical protein